MPDRLCDYRHPATDPEHAGERCPFYARWLIYGPSQVGYGNYTGYAKGCDNHLREMFPDAREFHVYRLEPPESSLRVVA